MGPSCVVSVFERGIYSSLGGLVIENHVVYPTIDVERYVERRRTRDVFCPDVRVLSVTNKCRAKLLVTHLSASESNKFHLAEVNTQ